MKNVRKLLTKEQVLTIPNAMSLFRLLIVPLIWFSYTRGDEYLAIALIAVSALTDVLDGVVARRLNMVSDLGKILDPLADKLTHLVLLLCLISRYRHIAYLLVILVVKEILLLIFGGLVLSRTNTVNSAKWHGKLATVMFEVTMLVLMLFPDINPFIADVLIDACGCIMIISVTLYLAFYIGLLKTK